MSEKHDTDSIRISQILAGALAAVTAALLGSTMGVAGTVAGAGLASVVTTVGGALYLRSIQRTRQRVRTVREKVSNRTLVGQEAPAQPADDPAARGGPPDFQLTDEDRQFRGSREDAEPTTAEPTTAEPAAAESAAAEQEPPAPPRRLRWPVIIASSVLAFALGMLAITGVEWLRGEPLSGGEGTSFGNIVRPQHNGGDRAPDGDDTGPATPPPSTSTVTETEPPPTSTTTPTEPTPPPSESSRPPTTTPPTSTTGGEPSGGPPPPPPPSG